MVTVLTCRQLGQETQYTAAWLGCVGSCRTCEARLGCPRQKCPRHADCVAHQAAAKRIHDTGTSRACRPLALVTLPKKMTYGHLIVRLKHVPEDMHASDLIMIL